MTESPSRRTTAALNGASRPAVAISRPECAPSVREAPAIPGSWGVPGAQARRPQVRVLACDDHPVYLFGLRLLLTQVADITLVGECSNPVQAWSERFTTRPDVVIVGQRLSGGSADLVRRFDSDGIGVVVLADSDDERYLFDALRAGARGYLFRHVSTQRLLDGIRAVYRHETVLDGAPALQRPQPRDTDRHIPLQPSVSPLIHELTARQREVARLVAAGLSNAEVAAQLYVSQATVKSHLTIILKRLNLRDRTQLAILVNRSLGVDAVPPGWS